MNKTNKMSAVLLKGSLITAMLLAIFVGINSLDEAISQTGNATSTTNQTATSTTNQTATSTTNQTATSTINQTSQSLGNLTRSDFLPAQENLATARDGIFADMNLQAFTTLNDADSDLYIVVDGVGPEIGDLLLQQLTPVRESINNAQEAIVSGDFAKALEDINSASTALVKITWQLPPEVEEE
jgi:hypothetical protein